MTLAELCHAAITLSDNTAANLILETLGGPQGLTAFARSLGDEVTRLDRWEPDLNESKPGDPRDTTSPRAMAMLLQQLVLGDVLSPRSRELLVQWMRATSTNRNRLAAGLPEGWKIGSKTGSSGNGSGQRRGRFLATESPAHHRGGLHHARHGKHQGHRARDCRGRAADHARRCTLIGLFVKARAGLPPARAARACVHCRAANGRCRSRWNTAASHRPARRTARHGLRSLRALHCGLPAR